jgi:hypothetical protein
MKGKVKATATTVSAAPTHETMQNVYGTTVDAGQGLGPGCAAETTE